MEFTFVSERNIETTVEGVNLRDGVQAYIAKVLCSGNVDAFTRCGFSFNMFGSIISYRLHAWEETDNSVYYQVFAIRGGKKVPFTDAHPILVSAPAYV